MQASSRSWPATRRLTCGDAPTMHLMQRCVISLCCIERRHEAPGVDVEIDTFAPLPRLVGRHISFPQRLSLAARDAHPCRPAPRPGRALSAHPRLSRADLPGRPVTPARLGERLRRRVSEPLPESMRHRSSSRRGGRRSVLAELRHITRRAATRWTETPKTTGPVTPPNWPGDTITKVDE